MARLCFSSEGLAVEQSCTLGPGLLLCLVLWSRTRVWILERRAGRTRATKHDAPKSQSRATPSSFPICNMTDPKMDNSRWLFYVCCCFIYFMPCFMRSQSHWNWTVRRQSCNYCSLGLYCFLMKELNLSRHGHVWLAADPEMWRTSRVVVCGGGRPGRRRRRRGVFVHSLNISPKKPCHLSRRAKGWSLPKL